MTQQPRFELFSFWRTSATYRIEISDQRWQVRQRRVARMADPLVHHRIARGGTAPGQRRCHWHLLPRQLGHRGRHLPGQPDRGDGVFKIEVTDIPTVDRIMAACEQLDAFAQADPRRQAGAPAA